MVRERPPGVSIPEALRRNLQSSLDRFTAAPERAAAMHAPINETPALSVYARKMWLRHDGTLARAIAAEIGAPLDDGACTALVHFMLESRFLSSRTPDSAAMDMMFALRDEGWASTSVVHARFPDSADLCRVASPTRACPTHGIPWYVSL